MSHAAESKPKVHSPNLVWLSQHREAAIDADLPVIDSHHHLWDFSSPPYFGADYVADLRSGHRVLGSVFVECTMGYLTDGPAELRPVGETAFAVSEAEAQAAGGQRICDGIVGFADLELGDRLEIVLDRHLDAAK